MGDSLSCLDNLLASLFEWSLGCFNWDSIRKAREASSQKGRTIDPDGLNICR